MTANKSLLLILLSLFSFTLFAQDLSNGLILHYTFDHISGINLTDDSGNAMTATLQGNAQSAEGYDGNALLCAEQADYALLPDNLTNHLESYTIAAWVKGNGPWSSWARIFDFGSGTDNNMFMTPTNGSNLRYAIKLNGGSEETIDATDVLPTGEWVHLAVTVDFSGGNTGSGILYLNGIAVGTNSNMSYQPNKMTNTTQNYIGKSQYNDPALNGCVDDFRVYNRALSATEIALLNGFSEELLAQYNALNIDDADVVTEDLSLPTTLGSQGVKVSWTSSNEAIITSSGHVTRPEKYNTLVTLTATLSYQNDTLQKALNVTVLALDSNSTLVAEWLFNNNLIDLSGENVRVTDNSGNNFTGTCRSDAKIVSIGDSEKSYNVLYLGKDKAYFDLGTAIGEAIYSLGDYTISIYYHRENNASDAYGQWLYAFSNGEDMNASAVGCMYFEPRRGAHTICSTNYNTETRVAMGLIPNGSWHHICYIQSGTTGRLYLDGVLKSSGTITSTPAKTLVRSGRSGTLYNFLGRPCYAGDAYLSDAYLYDFKLYNTALSSEELAAENITTTLTALDAAYAKNKDYGTTILQEEADALNIGDLTALTSDISLPVQGNLHNGIQISWSSSHPQLISDSGRVNRPEYIDFTVTLTATLSYGGTSLTKTFTATVEASGSLNFVNNLMVQYDFSTVEGTLVKDVSSSQLTGTLVNDAKVVDLAVRDDTIKVLQLGKNKGYFDMGSDIGAFIPSLNDYTIGCYYFIDPDYGYLNWNGNALWNFSNSDDADGNEDAYMTCFLNNQGVYITPTYWIDEQSVYTGKPAGTNQWHHLAYTQQGHIGTLYIDGLAAESGTVNYLPSACMIQPGKTGTACNWIGRSCYAGDVYLQQSMVYDFRMYNKALKQPEIESSVMAVEETLRILNKLPASGVETALNGSLKVYRDDCGFCLEGLQSGDHIQLIGITGRILYRGISENSLKQIDMSSFAPGLYLIRIQHGQETMIQKAIW